MFLLSLSEDEIRHDEGGNNNEERAPDSPEGVWETLSKSSSKGSLLNWRDVVLSCSSDSHSELAKAKSESSHRCSHVEVLIGLQ